MDSISNKGVLASTTFLTHNWHDLQAFGDHNHWRILASQDLHNLNAGDGRHTHAAEVGEDASNTKKMTVEEVLITTQGTVEEIMSTKQGRKLGRHVGNDACQLHS